jgi:serine protease AprX
MSKARILVAALAVAALALPAASVAAPAKRPAAYLPGSLLADAHAHPGQRFRVLVELKQRASQSGFATKVRGAGLLQRRFRAINGLSAELPGAAIIAFSRLSDVVSITRDAPVHKTDFAPDQVWQQSVGADAFWPGAAGAPAGPLPAIAIVDSGIDADRAADLGARVVANVPLSSLAPGATSDGAGHGTFVAALAAGSASKYPGVAPAANLVNLRVMDDSGMAMTSDVIAAADWILAHHDEYGIKVANFSLLSSAANSFRFDPLDHAIERLWFAGITVVTAAGNQGDGSAVPMAFAPANDPFAITVGAVATNDTADRGDDTIAPFSAYGYTPDGFAKPELVAPGRYITSAMSPGATIYGLKADRVVEPGYLNLSGTSFSAPVVSGAAAVLLAQHPDWTPDQVKGALMATATHVAPGSQGPATGLGEIDIAAAAGLAAPPNPNAGLDRFIVDDASVAGGKAFDGAGWTDAAQADPSWNQVSWESVSWESVSWESVSWESVSWESVSWESVSWESVSWESVSEAQAALAEVSWLESSDAL